MSKSRLAQALVLGALLAAANLAAMTGVAHAKGGGGSAAIHDDDRRPPTQGQVGEPWHPRVSPPAPSAEPDSRPRWPVAPLVVLTAALALAGGLAARRAGRRARPRLTA
jgi:hypothetical protein